MLKKNAFEIEKEREKLAKNQEYSKLKTMYSKKFSEIKDNNNSKFWDISNQDHEISEKINPMTWNRINIVKKFIPKNSFKILDIGFGSAQLEKNVFKSKKIFNWHGIDISPESVKKASMLYPQGKFKTGNIIELKYRNNFFDCVITLEVLEHIKPNLIFKALSEIYRVLKPNGIFIASVPLNENLEEMILKGENPNAHLRAYSPDLIKAELEISSFNILKEKILYAFNDNYKFKSLIAKLIPGIRKPNNIILLAQKK